MNTFDLDKEYIAPTYKRFPVEIVSGSGSYAFDSEGKRYIDLGSGIAVNTFGYADKEWAEAVSNQLFKLQHTSNLYYTSPCASLAELLCKKSEMKKVFFSNSGAEANECAIKAARKYAFEKKGKDCFNIITLRNSFHGRTITTLAATGQDSFHCDFLPLTQGFISISPTVEELDKIANDNVAAIMFEIVRGEGGVLPLDPKFVSRLKEISEEHDILLIADEVQCGNGRTGKLFSYMHYDIKPDIVTTAKGLGGGLPIGATLFGKKTENVFSPGLHGSTFGGNPAVCAGAMSIISRIDENLLSEVQEKSELIKAELQGASGIKSISGMGLMLGIETEKPASEIVNACLEKGVLLLTAKNKIRLLPALNIQTKLLKEALGIIKEACRV